jgi:hypothetical protein
MLSCDDHEDDEEDDWCRLSFESRTKSAELVSS